ADLSVGCGPLGMEDGFISDDSITASSYHDNTLVPWHGRLNTHLGENGGGWAPIVIEATGEYLQIDLRSTYNISKVATQGRSGKISPWNQWMTEYSLQYSDDGEKWTDYGVSGSTQVFPGNSDEDTIVSHVLPVPIIARYVRFVVRKWNNWATMRVELSINFAQSNGQCELLDTDIMFQWPHYLRNNTENFNHFAIKTKCLDFPCKYKGICIPFYNNDTYSCNCTQVFNGKNCENQNLNCRSINFARSNGQCELLDTDMFQWPHYLENNQQNQDFNHFAIKTKCLDFPCKYKGICIPFYNNDTYSCNCTQVFNGKNCENQLIFCMICNLFGTFKTLLKPDLSVGCGPLGMEDGFISDDSITASSYYDNRFVPWHGRLNTHLGGNAGGWLSKVRQTGEYLQIDLRSTYNISKVATQGRAGKSSSRKQWMTEYSLQYSDDGEKWTDYGVSGTQVFPGNSDEDTIVSHVLPVSIIARYVRFVVRKWNNWATMRVELYNDCKSF
ncbi:hypothetical protein QZH41_013426, partial [Actinostola sp. cb2023]